MGKFKLSLPITILLASIVLGGFYYASEVNKQQSIEKQQQIKIEQEKQDQLAKELKEREVKEQAEQALNTCIANAEENYSDQWYRECKAQGKITSRCITIKELTFDEYTKQYNIQENKDKPLEAMLAFFKEQNECSCRLSSYNADSVNKTLQDNKDECFKKYPQK